MGPVEGHDLEIEIIEIETLAEANRPTGDNIEVGVVIEIPETGETFLKNEDDLGRALLTRGHVARVRIVQPLLPRTKALNSLM